VYEEEREEDAGRRDDRALAVLMLVLGLARVVPALCMRESFGTEVTVAVLMLIAAICMLAGVRTRPRVRIR